MFLYTLRDKYRNDSGMTAIPRKYITDAKSRIQAVVLDLETFNRMESIIEDHGLAQFMEASDGDETLSVHEAKKYYRSLKKE
jgi:predicted Ser/Thr protein kinase